MRRTAVVTDVLQKQWARPSGGGADQAEQLRRDIAQ